ncbi:phenylacetate--CoA ligase family protein [Blastococcus sp. Marseille-P5729]|uniref:phenylacetate--CoA ligase family protein n=1 Tax=Blastococcus sp. Marseille-P5729 TaxID=2086582 RepID=UPI0018FF0F67|nr:AMP-binding protein [Blastococcus sp. Marseille-P5729]
MMAEATTQMFDRDAQTMPVEQRREQQQRRLQELLARVQNASPQHRQQLHGIDAREVTLDNLHELPTVSKKELREYYPLGALCVERGDLRRIHATSGTSGRPTIVAYTERDMEVMGRTNARVLDAAGAKQGTLVHNAYGYGLFTGGLGMHQGIEHLGACTVPISGGMTQRQVTLIRDLYPEILLSTPSYAATLADAMAHEGIAASANSLRVGIFGAEPWSEGMRASLQAGLGIRAMDIYGMCELQGPGVAFESLDSPGHMFINEDFFYPECIDPYTGEAVPEGEVGELVFTTLTKEAVPVIRYRTGDLASLQRIDDPGGRTFITMSRIVGRSDDMLVIRGVNVFPSEIEAVLLTDDRVSTAYTLVIDERGNMPTLTAVTEPMPDVPASQIDPMLGQLQHALKDRLGISCQVVLSPPGGLPRTEVGKAVRVKHWRKGEDSPFPGLLG